MRAVSFMPSFAFAAVVFGLAASPTTAQQNQTRALRDISDIMKSAERKIRQTDTGEPTQAQQKEAISRLQALIDELIQRESPPGGPGGASAQRPAESSAKTPAGPAPKRKLRPARKSRAKAWGDLSPGERAAIETELQSKMSARYRKMLECYFRELNRHGRC